MMRMSFGLLVLCAAALASAQSPSDFAYRLSLDTQGDTAFYRVELPAPIYEGAVRPDLGDLRIFNGAGETVPYAWLSPPLSARESTGTVDLPLFPLRVEAGRRDLGDISITLKRGADGTQIDLTTRDGQTVAPERLVGYLIDASALTAPIASLRLALDPGANTSARARVEASDDLAAWRAVVSGAPIVDLQHGGRRLTRDRIDLPATRAKYLRITFEPGSPTPPIASLRAEFGDRIVEAPRQWRQGSVVADNPHPGEFEFDVGGRFPIDRVTLELPELNTVAPAQLFVRAATNDEWRPVGSAVFYRVKQDGSEVVNPPATIRANERYWKVRIDRNAGGVGPKAPRLSVGWYPRVLVFAARGEGPFELAYGSATAGPSALAVDTLVPNLDRTDPSRTTFVAATVGAATAAPAIAALRKPIDARRWLLWGSLVLAVVVLGAMAVTLSRQMNRASAATQAPAQPDDQATSPQAAATSAGSTTPEGPRRT